MAPLVVVDVEEGGRELVDGPRKQVRHMVAQVNIGRQTSTPQANRAEQWIEVWARWMGERSGGTRVVRDQRESGDIEEKPKLRSMWQKRVDPWNTVKSIFHDASDKTYMA